MGLCRLELFLFVGGDLKNILILSVRDLSKWCKWGGPRQNLQIIKRSYELLLPSTNHAFAEVAIGF